MLIRSFFIIYLSLVSVVCSGRPLRKDVSYLDRQFIFTQNISKLIQFIYSTGYKCTLGETFRSREQALIYAKLGKGISDSNHCYRLAIDINLFDKKNEYLHDTKEYEVFGEYWEKLNPFNEWGGRWIRSDGNHFEMD